MRHALLSATFALLIIAPPLAAQEDQTASFACEACSSPGTGAGAR
jgi:hypothetical protein